MTPSEALRAYGDGYAVCFYCRREWPVKDGEYPGKCCDSTPAIYDEMYRNAVAMMDGDD